MTPRVYLPDAGAHRELLLSAEKSRHLTKVLRLKVGAVVVIFDGQGNAYPATIRRCDKDGVHILSDALLPSQAADSSAAIHIGQALCAAAKMDWAVEKMTELGAVSITPLITERAQTFGGERQQARWQRLIIAAAEQCGRARLPDIHPPRPLSDWAAATATAGGKRIHLSPRATASLAEVTGRAFSAITVAVGPESGFSPVEEQRLADAGFQAATLGARILRTETAGLAALAQLTMNKNSNHGV